MKNKILMVPVALLMMIATISGALAADWTTGVSYSIGDVVTYQGTDYECVQSHTSQAGWTPTAVPALWQVYVSSGDPFVNGDEWQAGVSYAVGDEVTYEEQLYVVRQAHTSQADWLPSVVLALYKPVVVSSQVTYLPPESNYDASTYIGMSRADMIEFMDFSYVDSEVKDEYLEYSWNYLHPQLSGSEIQWLYKPISIRLYYTDIEKCLYSYTEQQCINGLVLGTTTISYTDENNQTTSVTSVLDKAQTNAYNAIDYALGLQTDLQSSLSTGAFQPTSMGFTLE